MTVVIPTLGRSPFFAEALASAVAEAPAEVIVVADGARGVEAPGARVLQVEHRGRSAARNTGADAARTAFVAFLDDDDVMRPGGLARRRDALAAASGAPLSFGRVTVVDGDGRAVDPWNDLLGRRFARTPTAGVDDVELLAGRTPIYTSATVARREAFLAAGGYDPSLDAHEDLDLYLRLAMLGPLLLCAGGPVAAYRLHGANTPSDRLYEGLLAVVAKHLPEADGRRRRLLLERRVEALWGLGRYQELRREAAQRAFSDPRLLLRPPFLRRLAGSLLRRR